MNSFRSNKPGILRIIVLIAIIGILLLGILIKIFHQDLYDPLLLRLLIASYCLIFFILSFKVEAVRRNIQIIWYIGCALFSSWILFLLYMNNLNTQYILGAIVVFFGISLGFEKRLYFRIYIITFMIILYFVIYHAQSANVNKDTFVVQFTILAFFNFFIIDNFLKSQNELRQSNYYLETLIEGSGRASVLLGDNNKILKFNNLANVSIKELLNQSLEKGICFTDMLPEDKRKAFNKGIIKAKNGENLVISSNVSFNHTDDQWYEFRFMPIVYKSKTAVIFSFIDISDTKKVEHGLFKQYSFINNLVSSAPFEIYVYNLKTDKIFWINKHLLKKLGYKEFGDHGSDILEIIHPDDISIYKSDKTYLSHSEQENNLTEKEFRVKNVKGVWEWAQAKEIVLKKDNNQQVVDILVFLQIITERKKQEIQMERLSMIASHTINGVVITGLGDRVEWINEGFTQITGFTLDDIKGKRPADFLQGKDTDPLEVESIGQQVLSKETFTATLINYRKDGTPFWNRFTAHPIKDSKNEILGYFSIQTDVTEEKRLMDELKISVHEFKSLFEQSPIGMVKTDLKGYIIQSNKAFSRLFGYSKEELLKINFLELLHIEDQQESSKKGKKLLDGEVSSFEMERRYIHKNKHIIYVLIKVVLLKNKNGKAEAFLGQLLDITKINQSKKVIKKKNLELKATNKVLEKTNTELDNILYSAAHDLRAPLTSVLGLINLSKGETDGNLLIKYINMIRVSIEKLDSFIVDIVTYSRNRRLDVSWGIINFKSIINDILNECKYLNGFEDLSVIIDVQDQIPFYSDEVRINMILRNLLVNAINYHDFKSETPFIEVNIKTENEEGIIIITDNGPGISKKNHEKIFDMFFRASNKSKGTGLGLYIVKEAIKKMNGSIDINSKKGKGASFVISIPNLKE